jgi:hypothetical protein
MIGHFCSSFFAACSKRLDVTAWELSAAREANGGLPRAGYPKCFSNMLLFYSYFPHGLPNSCHIFTGSPENKTPAGQKPLTCIQTMVKEPNL